LIISIPKEVISEKSKFKKISTNITYKGKTYKYDVDKGIESKRFYDSFAGFIHKA